MSAHAERSSEHAEERKQESSPFPEGSQNPRGPRNSLNRLPEHTSNGRRKSNEPETRPTQTVLSNYRRGVVTYRTRGMKERTNYPWTSALPPAGIPPVVVCT